jgi:hypothetical protein
VPFLGRIRGFRAALVHETFNVMAKTRSASCKTENLDVPERSLMKFQDPTQSPEIGITAPGITGALTQSQTIHLTQLFVRSALS